MSITIPLLATCISDLFSMLPYYLHSYQKLHGEVFCPFYNTVLTLFGDTLGRKTSLYEKMTFWKSHFWLNSHFQNLIFDKFTFWKISFSSKFTISTPHFSRNYHISFNFTFVKIQIFGPHFSQNSHFFQTLNSREFLDKKLIFAPVWTDTWTGFFF